MRYLTHQSRIDDFRRTVFIRLIDDMQFLGCNQPTVLAAQANGLAAVVIDLSHDGFV